MVSAFHRSEEHLAAVNPPTETYWIMVCVNLRQEILPDTEDEDDDDRPIVGYFQTFGVTADSEDKAGELVTEAISDGEIDWSESTISPGVVIHTLDPVIIARAGDWTEPGIWYKSGRGFFPAD